MKIKILQYIVIFTLISSCTQTIINVKQTVAEQSTLENEDIQEIQKIMEKCLTGYANRNIGSIMETISPNYSRSIDGTTIDYAGFRAIIEINNAKFFSSQLSCFVDNIKILESNVMDNKAVINFEYKFCAFDKNSMQWMTYGTIRKVTFFKENDKWKIITTGNKIRMKITSNDMTP